MADTEYLKTFTDGETILATDTNNNNEYLLNKISDNAGALTTYVDNQISTVNSSVSSQISTLTNTLNSKVTELQNSITAAQNTANGKLSATFSKNSNGYCKFSNGFIIQWGYMNNAETGTVTFPTPFSSTARLAGAAYNYANTGTGMIFNWITLTKTNFSYCLRSGGGKGYGTPATWIAVGY